MAYFDAGRQWLETPKHTLLPLTVERMPQKRRFNNIKCAPSQCTLKHQRHTICKFAIYEYNAQESEHKTQLRCRTFRLSNPTPRAIPKQRSTPKKEYLPWQAMRLRSCPLSKHSSMAARARASTSSKFSPPFAALCYTAAPPPA